VLTHTQFGTTKRRQPVGRMAAQITPYGRRSDSEADDQVAAHIGGSRAVSPRDVR